ncbi:MAG TPA: Crp/Fnr family transcriptional regulator [Actinomycetota bacterium]|nr:Crp/Fnr family transcriptional regulator [Actinomycetota bacterium]
MSDHACLRETDLFLGLLPEEMASWERRLPLLRVAAGELVFTPLDRSRALYIVKRGRVRLYRLWQDGRQVTLGAFESGEVFGTLELFGAAGRNAFAEAEQDSLLCLLREEDLGELIGRHPEVALRLLRILGARLAAVEEQLENIAFRSAEQRVARSLLRLLGRLREPRLRVSHEQIARSAGVARETVTKVLGAMEREGWLQTGYRSLRVLKPARIEEAARDKRPS